MMRMWSLSSYLVLLHLCVGGDICGVLLSSLDQQHIRRENRAAFKTHFRFHEGTRSPGDDVERLQL